MGLSLQQYQRMSPFVSARLNSFLDTDDLTNGGRHQEGTTLSKISHPYLQLYQQIPTTTN